MPRCPAVQFSGIISEALGVDLGPWGLDKVDGRESHVVASARMRAPH